MLNAPSSPLTELESPMAKCDVCGNDYANSFQVVKGGATYTFDSFECAIHKVAPRCTHCGCAIIGHGVEADAEIYCCASCARHHGVTSLVDNADKSTSRGS
jgi:hypothetical protein